MQKIGVGDTPFSAAHSERVSGAPVTLCLLLRFALTGRVTSELEDSSGAPAQEADSSLG